MEETKFIYKEAPLRLLRLIHLRNNPVFQQMLQQLQMLQKMLQQLLQMLQQIL